MTEELADIPMHRILDAAIQIVSMFGTNRECENVTLRDVEIVGQLINDLRRNENESA